MFENRTLRRKFGSKKQEATEEWKSSTMGSFVISTQPQISLDRPNQGE
jgi:hypothetical protein